MRARCFGIPAFSDAQCQIPDGEPAWVILPRKRKSMTMSPTMQPLSLLPATTTETKGTEELIYFETTETKGTDPRGTTQRVERKQRERAMKPRGCHPG